MAQEVQTSLNYKAELNLIEWVWHQENKVREHTQVEQAFGYWCKVNSCYIYCSIIWSGDTPEEKGNISISSQWGMTEFTTKSGAIRIPLAWVYLAEFTTRWGSSSMTMTNYLKVSGQVVFQNTTTSPSTTVSNSMVLNLWRYDTVELWGKMHYSGTGSATTYTEWTLTLKKL